MYKYIFFDLDGTLTNSGEGIIKSLEYAFTKLKLEVPDKPTLTKFIGPPLVVSFHEYMNFDDDTTEKAIKLYRERYEDKGIFENEPYEGIPNLLKELTESGFRLAVATTKPEHMAIRVIEHYSLAPFFETVSGAISENDTKESVIRRACERMNINECEWDSILMIGDRKFDIIGAHNCNIKCCGVEYGFAPKGEFQQYRADYIVKDVNELRTLIFSS